MKKLISELSLVALALLCSSVSMAAQTVNAKFSIPNPATSPPLIGQQFTVTLQGINVANVGGAEVRMVWDATKVAFINPLAGDGICPTCLPATGPLAVGTGSFISVYGPNGSRIVQILPGSPPLNGNFDIAVLTFQTIAPGNPNIVFSHDGITSGWFDNDTADLIPTNYTQTFTPLAAVDDGPIAVVEGFAMVIPVGANDTGFTTPATVTVTTLPTKGTITAISAPGPAAGMTITYTANIGAVGADSFVYDMTDSTPASDAATVTLNISPPNAVPGVFSFTDQTNVPLTTVRTSNAITVTGINVPTAISVVGGEYAINGGAFTALSSTVSNGNTVRVRHTSSAAPDTAVDTLLDVGGVTDTFTTTTLKYAIDDSVATFIDQPLQINVLQNDFGLISTVYVGIWVDPVHGSVSVNGSPGSPSGIRITYTPNPGFIGSDSFEYWVESGLIVDYAVVTVDVINNDLDGDGIVNALDNCKLVTNPNQCDSDTDGYGNRCDGDLTNNGFTNSQDYVVFRTKLGGVSSAPTYNVGDINCNGFVNSQDYVLFRGLLGSAPGPSGLVP